MDKCETGEHEWQLFVIKFEDMITKDIACKHCDKRVTTGDINAELQRLRDRVRELEGHKCETCKHDQWWGCDLDDYDEFCCNKWEARE